MLPRAASPTCSILALVVPPATAIAETSPMGIDPCSRFCFHQQKNEKAESFPFFFFSILWRVQGMTRERHITGLFWELNPGPLAPEARIIPLDQTASYIPMKPQPPHSEGKVLVGPTVGQWH